MAPVIEYETDEGVTNGALVLIVSASDSDKHGRRVRGIVSADATVSVNALSRAKGSHCVSNTVCIVVYSSHL